MISGEFSFDLDEKSVENFKKAINYDEIEARHKRFMNGTETIGDLINGILHYRIKNDDDLDLDVVEFKYYQKMMNLYLKEKEKNNELEEDRNYLLIEGAKLVGDKEILKQTFKDSTKMFYIHKDKLRKIIYPSPENPIPIEVQQSEMYKKLLKEMEE